MNVFVTILALRGRNLEIRVCLWCLWYMALVKATGMWTPSSGYFVAACSFTPNVEGAHHLRYGMTRICRVRARTELAMMRVLMTIRAFGERHRRLEIIMGVAILARYHLVLPSKGILFSSGRNPAFASRESNSPCCDSSRRSLEGALVHIDVHPMHFSKGVPCI